MPFKKGHKINVGRTGLVHSKEARERMSLARSGAKNYQWKGAGANYKGIHRWVIRWKGRPSSCEMCGDGKGKRFEWANIDHMYRRVLDDYIRLCSACHGEYDKTRKLRIRK